MINSISNFCEPRINYLKNECLGDLKTEALCLGATVFGVIFTPITIVNKEREGLIQTFANSVLFSSGTLTCLYVPLMKVINPSVTMNHKFKYSNASIGIITGLFAKPFYQIARTAAKEEQSFWVKHAASRSFYALGAIVATVTRIADLSLGLFAVALSVITVGKFDKINSFAALELSGTGLICDICISVRGIFNPQSYQIVKEHFQKLGAKDKSPQQ